LGETKWRKKVMVAICSKKHAYKKLLIMRLLFLLLTFFACSYSYCNSLFEGSYADLGEVRLHYKIAGTGVPIIFLHGGTGTSDSWNFYLSRFSDSYQAIAPDSRGQGLSSRGKGPITYGRMAGDVVKLMDFLNIDRAHIVGHSDGGVIALHLLIDYPERIHSATLLGTPYHINNYPAEASKALEEYLEALATSDTSYEIVKSRHAAAENLHEWMTLVNMWGKMWRTQPTFSEAEIGLINTPVLIVKTDHDFFIPADVFDRLAMQINGAQVLHIPEGRHSVYRQKPEEVSTAILALIQEIEDANQNRR
jgi:pimeloyl-ACP methyl ester carboxylesterase